MSPHMNHQHVLRLERLLLARAVLPLAYETLLVGVDVVVGDVLQGRILIIVNVKKF